MAKGAESKQKLLEQIMKDYPEAFLYGGKELRVPFTEDGARVEIKVALTCAKTNVGGDAATPMSDGQPSAFSDTPTAALEPTAEEKQNIANLMERLGI